MDGKLLNCFLAEWLTRKRDLADETISNVEGMEWKQNWLQAADDLGKFEPEKQWHKQPETTSQTTSINVFAIRVLAAKLQHRT